MRILLEAQPAFVYLDKSETHGHEAQQLLLPAREPRCTADLDEFTWHI